MGNILSNTMMNVESLGDLTLEYMEELISLTLLYFDLSFVNWNQVSTVFGSTIARPEQKIQSDQ